LHARKLTTVYVFPFNPKHVVPEGAASIEEFKVWLNKYGDDFYYSLGNTQTGDIIVFAWIEQPREWVMVGDAIIKSNHKTGFKECKCEDIEAYLRHILTGGLRIYPRSISSKQFALSDMGPFATLSPDKYFDLIEKTVELWKR